MPGHFCWASALQDLVIVTLLISAVWQDVESWPKCSLTHALSRPSPGLTSPQSCLKSAPQAWRAAPSCATAPVGASSSRDARTSLAIPTLSDRGQSGEGRAAARWTPAFAGVTKERITAEFIRSFLRRGDERQKPAAGFARHPSDSPALRSAGK